MKWFDGYLESISTLTAGQIDANSQTRGDTVSSVAGGAEQVVVLVNDNSTGNDKVIVRDGIGAIADLKGKKVAAEEGTVDHFLLLLGLQKAGLTAEDIQFVPLETGKAAAAPWTCRTEPTWLSVIRRSTTTAMNSWISCANMDRRRSQRCR